MANISYDHKALGSVLGIPAEVVVGICAVQTKENPFFGSTPKILEKLSSFTSNTLQQPRTNKIAAQNFLQENFSVIKTDNVVSVTLANDKDFSTLTVKKVVEKPYINFGYSYLVDVVDATKSTDNTSHRVNFASTSIYGEPYTFQEGHCCLSTTIVSTTSNAFLPNNLDESEWLGKTGSANKLIEEINKGQTLDLPYRSDNFSILYEADSFLLGVRHTESVPGYSTTKDTTKLKGVVTDDFKSTGLTLTNVSAVQNQLAPVAAPEATA